MDGQPKCLPAGLALLLLPAALALAGCASRTDPQEDRSALQLRKIAQAYDLASDIRGRPPRNADELGRFFKELGETGDPDALLRSPRDGQPYVILFGVPFDVADRNTILVYEKNGAEGQRYVLTRSRDVRRLTDEEFARASFAGGHRPADGK